MSRRAWAWLRLVGGAAILGVIVWRVGTGPVIDGIRTISTASVVAAVALTAVTTVAAAYRWSVVADGLGVRIGLRPAIAAYYRSQFLNTALPGGVLGDAHRAVRHGQDVCDVNHAARAVVWERCAGQAVQVVLALAVLVLAPSPVHGDLPLVLGFVALAAAAVVAAGRLLPRSSRVLRAVRADVRNGLVAQGRWVRIGASSVVVVAGHTATFVLAARVAGVGLSLVRLLPLAMLVLLAMAVPINIGGWGPREGVAAWVFGAAGLGAGAGVATAVVYGVMALVAGLPGALVIVGEGLASAAHTDGVTDA